MKHFIATHPPALPLDKLRDALHAAHLPCKVASYWRDAAKVTPGKGIDKRAAEAFIKGFIAGFNA